MKKIAKASLLVTACGLFACGSQKTMTKADNVDYLSTAFTNRNDTLWTVVTDLPPGENKCDIITKCSGHFMDKFTRQEVGIAGPIHVVTEEIPEQDNKGVPKMNPLKVHYNVVVYSEEGEKLKELTTRYKPALETHTLIGRSEAIHLKDTSGVRYTVPPGAAVAYKAIP